MAGPRIAAVLLAALLAAPALHAQGGEGRRLAPGPFDAIEIGGAAEVRLQQGAVDELLVEGGERDRERIEATVHNGTLRIDSSGSWQFWNSRRAQLTVTVRQLSRLTISGAATVTAPAPFKAGRLAVSISGSGLARFDQLDAQRLVFGASGAGDADVAGRVDELSIAISGRSEFRGENLAARDARVSIAGIGDVKVWATEALSMSVSGVGRIEYWGAPSVRRSASGVATVVDRGPKPAP